MDLIKWWLSGWALIGLALCAEAGTNVVGTAFSPALFDGVHVIDVKAATQAWVDRLGKIHDIGRGSPVQIYPDAKGLNEAVNADRFELGVLLATDFVQLQHPERLEVGYVPSNGGKVLQSLLLLVRRDSAIRSLEELRGKSILYPINRYLSVATLWTENQLLENKLATSREAFFSEVRTHGKTSGVVLPVYFGKCDACVVSEGSYAVMTELNPQVARELMVLKVSPPYLASLVCLRKQCDEELKRKLEQAVMKLHESVEGAQVLISFHLDKYVFYQEGMLDNTKALVSKNLKLKAVRDGR